MFDNVNRSILWDVTPAGVKTRDADTPQLTIDSEKRGQTERFLLACGSLVDELFSDIEKGFHASDPLLVDFNPSDVSAGMVPALLKRYNLQFVDLSEDNIATIRNVLDEIFHAWRLKGTDAFMYWILGKLFGWRLRNTVTLASSVLRCSVNGCTLYDPDLLWEEQMILYDETQLTPDDKTTTVIDVLHDPEFWIKKDLLEKMMTDWGYPRTFQFINY